MDLKRRNLKLSATIAIISALMLPSNPDQSTFVLEYKYGFPMKYITFFQTKPSSKWFAANFFTGNEGLSIDPGIFLINILIIYFIIKFVRKLLGNN